MMVVFLDEWKQANHRLNFTTNKLTKSGGLENGVGILHVHQFHPIPSPGTLSLSFSYRRSYFLSSHISCCHFFYGLRK